MHSRYKNKWLQLDVAWLVIINVCTCTSASNINVSVQQNFDDILQSLSFKDPHEWHGVTQLNLTHTSELILQYLMWQPRDKPFCSSSCHISQILPPSIRDSTR